MKTRILITISFLLFAFSSFSQIWNYEAKIKDVSQNGFQNIKLLPELKSKLQANFGDIRIYDEKNNEISYILHTDKPSSQFTIFKEYKIILKEHKNNYTRIVFQNPEKKEIRNICVQVKNNAVSKWLRINGGDDQKTWYSLSDIYRFEPIENNVQTFDIRILNFPLSNYEYYEILIEDLFHNPINVLKVGYYDTEIEHGKYSELKNIKFTQTIDSKNKTSLIHINFDEFQYIDKLEFEIKGAKYYLRKAELFENQETENSKHKKEIQEFIHSELNLCSYCYNTIALPSSYMKDFYLRIYNNDDRPLDISAIKAYQLNSFLTAQLEKTSQYTLKFGDAKQKPPVYDLQFFADSINKELPTITPFEIKLLTKKEGETIKPTFISPTVMWAIIILVALFVGFITVKMLNEMKNKN